MQWNQSQSKAIGEVQQWVKQGIAAPKHDKGELVYRFNCILPSFQNTFYWKNVVDEKVTKVLEECGSLNWWQFATRLHAVHISRDQHSLFHSVSVSLWGIMDFENVLSSLLETSFKLHSCTWGMRFAHNSKHFAQVNELSLESGIVLSQHIFALANILQRPVIVISDEVNSFTQKDKGQEVNMFHGIYLPLMLKPIDCSKTPIFLAYCKYAFYPLVMEAPVCQCETNSTFEMKHKIFFPLVKNDLSTLPIKFLQESEEMKAGEILQDYLIVKETDCIMDQSSILFSESHCQPLPEDRNTMLKYSKTFVQLYGQGNTSDEKMPPSPVKSYKRMTYKNINDKNQIMKTEIGHMNQDQECQFDQSFGSPSPCLQEPEMCLQTNTILGLTLNQNGQHENQTGVMLYPDGPVSNEFSQIIASAPEMNMSEEPLSMTQERCLSCKSYRSSIKTFPFCHECFESHNNRLRNEKSFYKHDTPKPATLLLKNSNNLQIINDATSPMLISIADQGEKLANYSPKDSSMSVVSPSTETGVVNSHMKNEQEQNLVGEKPAFELSLFGNYPAQSCNNFVEISSDPPVCQSHHITVTSGLKKCASPVCNEMIGFPEQLCQRCIKILKVHHLSNCNKSCCNNTAGENKASHGTKHSGKSQDKTKIAKFPSPTVSSKQQPILIREKKEPNLNEYKQCAEKHENTSITPVSEVEKADLSIAGLQIYSSHPQSTMVTSITSVYDTENIISSSSQNIATDSFDQKFAEIENTLKKDAVKCKTPLCFNCGNKDKDYYCNVCSSVKQGNLDCECTPAVGVCNAFHKEQDDYSQSMDQLESQFKRGSNKCRTPLCSNFGNKQKNNYCNVCVTVSI